jgi:hypothetical protein
MNDEEGILEKLGQKLLGMYILVSKSVATPPIACYHTASLPDDPADKRISQT